MKHPSPQGNATDTGYRSLHDNRDQLLLFNATFEVLIAAEDSGLYNDVTLFQWVNSYHH
jgi:hypothetical protein